MTSSWLQSGGYGLAGQCHCDSYMWAISVKGHQSGLAAHHRGWHGPTLRGTKYPRLDKLGRASYVASSRVLAT
jgi:hypothetical protein